MYSEDERGQDANSDCRWVLLSTLAKCRAENVATRSERQGENVMLPRKSTVTAPLWHTCHEAYAQQPGILTVLSISKFHVVDFFLASHECDRIASCDKETAGP